MNKGISIRKLLSVAKQYLPEEDLSFIRKAYEFSRKAHKGQVRRSKVPYISHPLSVSLILAEYEQDAVTIIGGLLHDTLEDCQVVLADIKDLFGEDVAQLVDGVTKLSRLSFESREEAQAENYRKMLIAMAKDIRVVIIKLSDRLHNMRTLDYLSKTRQHFISQETLDIYAPLAHRLGMASIKWELEDLAFYYLYPKDFQKIKRLVSSKRDEREAFIEGFISVVKTLLKKASLIAIVKGRPKHFYSIYKKLKEQDISFEELYDKLGVRIIVKGIKDCYETLGLIHSEYKPVSGRFKDYIAMPKPNGYQSLHTVVLGPKGNPIEVQIRTEDMNQIADYGVAAHWHYKEKKKRSSRVDGDFTWLREIIELQKEAIAPRDFLKDLKSDLFVDEVFAFTPRGDVKVLSKGATALDFAYHIHTDVGHTCVGVKVNGQMVPLHKVLDSGDQVEVITSKKQKPNLDWLSVVQTRQARSKIRQWFKKQTKEERIEKGRHKLDRVTLVAGYELDALLKQVPEAAILDKFKITHLDDLYVSIVEGDISSKGVVRFLMDLLPQQPDNVKSISIEPRRLKKGDFNQVSVLGYSNIKVTLAKCCHPLPGDDIEGLVVIGKGVSVHRTDCQTILSLTEDMKARLVDVEWNTESTNLKTYPATLQIEGFDRVGLLQDIVQCITDLDVNIRDVKTRFVKGHTHIMVIIVVDVSNIAVLHRLKKKIDGISDVYGVTRVFY